MEATWIALIPPILAIIISLITKEVNLSLLVGIVVGCGLFCSFNPFTTVTTMFDIIVSGATHKECYRTNPEKYEKIVSEFIEKNLP